MRFLIILLFAISPLVSAEELDSKAIIAAHNKWRAQVGVGKLEYSDELAQSAQIWANELRNSNDCKMRHSSPDGKYGENIFWASAMLWSNGKRELTKVTADKAVDSWASERHDYTYSNNSCKPGKICGHYTQIIWKDTRKVGCAKAICEDSLDQVWVCQYQPAGNWKGRKPY